MCYGNSHFKGNIVLRKSVITLTACAVVALLAVDSAMRHSSNFLSATLGASITTQAELRGQAQKDLDVEVKEAPWAYHVIDDTSRGADGVKLADVNGDGLMDIVTGWEEGGVTRVYLHPGPAKAKERWHCFQLRRRQCPQIRRDVAFIQQRTL